MRATVTSFDSSSYKARVASMSELEMRLQSVAEKKVIQCVIIIVSLQKIPETIR